MSSVSKGNKDVPYVYNWTCTSDGRPCSSKTEEPLPTSTTANYTIPNTLIAENSFTITLTVSQPDSLISVADASASVSFMLKETEFPQVTLSGPLLVRKGESWNINLGIKWNNDVNIEWSSWNCEGCNSFDIATVIRADPTRKLSRRLAASSLSDLLPIKQNVFSQGETYGFKVNVRDAVNSAQSSTSYYSVTVRVPKINPLAVLSVNPSEGVFLETTFTIALSDFRISPSDVLLITVRSYLSRPPVTRF